MNVDAVLASLTLEEKASLTSGDGLWKTKAVPRAGVPQITVSDGPHGLRHTPPGFNVGGGGAYASTCFPPAVALGSSWDRDLVSVVGQAIGREARGLGVDVVLGPGINIKRSPLCGRNFEYFSEDPVLSGMLGAAFIRGLQGEGVGASLKHFAVNNQETDRFRVSADVDERTLREIYLTGFELAVTQGEPWTVMCSYNRLNGVYTSEHEWLLSTLLRDEWGFAGLVVSDWGAVNDRVAALRAGLDLEMPTSGGVTDAEIVAAVRSGALAEEILDRSARRVLALVDKSARTTGDTPGHHALARDVAAQCVVLLKNDGTLPLARGDRVAVVGALAREPRYQGAGSSKVTPTALDIPLDEIAKRAEVAFATGYRLDVDERDASLEAEAGAVAQQAAVTIVFMGLPAAAESEGYDRDHIDVPENQKAVLRAVKQTGTKVVVVLSNGGAVRVSDWEHDADAILEGWLLGQAGGGAVADILFGVVNPSGRLAETIPLRLEGTPAHLNFPGAAQHVRYGEGVFVGYRYHDAVDGAVSYPFGHGLSYTTFTYDSLGTQIRGSDSDLEVEVTASVTNAGDREGREVVQLYVRAPCPIQAPVRQLRGFVKLALEPGETKTASFGLGWRDFAYFDVGEHRWRVERGAATIEVGASSRDIRLAGTVELAVSPPKVTVTLQSTLAELASAAGGLAVLQRAVGNARQSPFLTEAGLRSFGGTPMGRLARFPGSHIETAKLTELIAELNGR